MMIYQLYAVICKELLQLSRDRSGLLVLLVMPVALVLIVTLVQHSVMQKTGRAAIEVLLVDQDRGRIGQTLGQQLRQTDAIRLIRQLDGEQLTESTARQLVLGGEYQFALVLPPGSSETLAATARQAADRALSGKPETEQTNPETALSPLIIYIDPAVQSTFRSAVVNALERIVLGLEMAERMNQFAKLFPQKMETQLTQMFGPYWALSSGGMLPSVQLNRLPEPQLQLQQRAAAAAGALTKLPTAVQQNVPAWALFGMFFIVVPLSGAFIRERHAGTLQRLLTLPLSLNTLVLGKVISYSLVCLGQFGFMLLMGLYLLPLLGADRLDLGQAPLALLVIALSAALAACGYGLMLGSVARTYEQALIFGAVSVVIAAALGGIMIPTYVMPHSMQLVSQFSPLGWGLSAFLKVFVRQGDLLAVLPQVSLLLSFFLVNTLVAGLALRRRGRG